MTKEFAFLLKKDMPRMLQIATDLIGTLETPGTASNPTIIAWQREIGDRRNAWYDKDSIPWCGLFVAVVVFRSGRAPVENYLRARDWADWGIESEAASLGDILVFSRKGGGHVGFYAGENDTHYYVLGGNQSDAVNIAKISKARCIAVRSPIYKVRPHTATPVAINHQMNESTNEA
jgi:uncharacterized protein (TIGR02594 family)